MPKARKQKQADKPYPTYKMNNLKLCSSHFVPSIELSATGILFKWVLCGRAALMLFLGNRIQVIGTSSLFCVQGRGVVMHATRDEYHLRTDFWHINVKGPLWLQDTTVTPCLPQQQMNQSNLFTTKQNTRSECLSMKDRNSLVLSLLKFVHELQCFSGGEDWNIFTCKSDFVMECGPCPVLPAPSHLSLMYSSPPVLKIFSSVSLRFGLLVPRLVKLIKSAHIFSKSVCACSWQIFHCFVRWSSASTLWKKNWCEQT